MNFRKNLKNNLSFVGIYLTIVGLVLYFSKNYQPIVEFSHLPNPTIFSVPVPTKIEEYSIAKVIRVFDGDTIEIEGGIKIRYIGIDSTEVYPKIQCFSQEAKSENEKLVLNKEVKLVKDVSETDKYGRLLRYVYVVDPEHAEGLFVNDDLVKNGFAKAMIVSPDIKYKDEFLESEKYARENNLGLWGKCF